MPLGYTPEYLLMPYRACRKSITKLGEVQEGSLHAARAAADAGQPVFAPAEPLDRRRHAEQADRLKGRGRHQVGLQQYGSLCPHEHANSLCRQWTHRPAVHAVRRFDPAQTSLTAQKLRPSWSSADGFSPTRSRMDSTCCCRRRLAGIVLRAWQCCMTGHAPSPTAPTALVGLQEVGLMTAGGTASRGCPAGCERPASGTCTSSSDAGAAQLANIV